MIDKIINGVINQGNQALALIDSIAPNAIEFSNNLLLKLLDENKDTAYGKMHDFASIQDYSEYRKRVPITDYSAYEELVERISESGEENVLFSRPIAQFCPTTGTTSAPKLIPVVKEALVLDTLYTMPASFALVDKALTESGKTSYLRNKGMVLVEIGKMSETKSGIKIGGISSTSLRDNYDLIEVISASPRELISPEGYMDSRYLNALFALHERNLGWIGSCYMTTVAGIMDTIESNWQNLCDDIEVGRIHEDVEMPEHIRVSLNDKLTADPERAAELREIFNGGFHEPVCPKIWPQLSCVMAIGSGSFKIHAEKVRRFVGEDIPFCNIVIEASETLVAVADGCNSEDFILVPQAGFFEFLPQDGGDICTMDQLQVGHKYRVVVTTISGFYRYDLGDVVEITGFHGQLPKLKFDCRGNVLLNIAGEKITEENLLKSIKRFSEKSGIIIDEYAAYADFSNAPGSYVVFIEPNAEIDLNRIEEYESLLDECLRENFGYDYERKAGNINPVILHIQQPQTHLFYRELQIMKGAPRNQLKPVRVMRNEEQKSFFSKMIEK